MIIENLVLSGGGPAMVLLHAGCIKELINTKTISMDNIKNIHGTSAGSITAAILNTNIENI